MEITDKHFIDWESHVFGYGYGTGEGPIFEAMKNFFAQMVDNHSYDYKHVQGLLGTNVTWLLINVFCHADIIEYGTSPRFGWLTNKGHALKNYVESKTVRQLCEIVSVDSDYLHCQPGHCHCEPEGCKNPLF